MEAGASAVSILVLQARSAGRGPAASLAALGPGVELEVLDPGEALPGAAADADLVVLDASAFGLSEVVLAELCSGTAPLLVVAPELSAEQALAWFRRGAADCVSLGRSGPHALRVAALEQVERRRDLRRRIRTERRSRADIHEIRRLRRQVLVSEKMASIGQLAAGVAHEINNPVGFIHANLAQMSEYVGDLRRVFGRVEALQQAAADGSPEAALREASARLGECAREVGLDFVLGDLAQALRESQEGAERIRHIVQDLREFSHPNPGERAATDINQCLDSTASMVWPMIRQLVVLEKEYRDLPLVDCHPLQIKQVFMNLMVNAYQSIEEKVGGSGGVGRIELRSERVGEGVCVTVSDTGTGIEPEHVARVFDPFFTTKAAGSGTGLGLATCYGIVERHGGTLQVESRPGQGASFRVWLPREAREEVAHA